MSNIQTGAERMPHDLSHLGFLAGQIGRLITISTTPVIAGDSFEMDAVGALRLSPLRRGLAIDSTVDIFTFYVPHRHVYGALWINFMKDCDSATPLPTVNTTGYIDHAAFLGTINPDTNQIPKHLIQGYLNIYNNYFKAPWMPDRDPDGAGTVLAHAPFRRGPRSVSAPDRGGGADAHPDPHKGGEGAAPGIRLRGSGGRASRAAHPRLRRQRQSPQADQPRIR